MESLSYADAAHLLRRMGFAGPPQEIEALAARGRRGAVDSLIDYEKVDNRFLEGELARLFPDYFFFSSSLIREWWAARLLLTKRPFEEKMTLFWHNHFATALSKVEAQYMFSQNLMLRSLALDRFDKLLERVSKDAAMLNWLDTVTNVIGRPNENFARELQELFTMGPADVVTGRPNYTEKDVKEVARAFTGWKHRYRFRQLKPPRTKFFVNPAEHDYGPKDIYGLTANWGGDDVITLICGREQTARFLVVKLFEFFVYPLAESEKDRAAIERFAGVYMASDHSIKELARAIFSSDEFFSPRARFALVKNPIELIVGAIRMLEAELRLDSSGPAAARFSAKAQLMGMDLFNPPDVAGWAMNEEWLSSSALMERYNFANQLATARNAGGMASWIPTERLARYVDASPEGTVQSLLSRLGPLEIDATRLQALVGFLQTDDDGDGTPFATDEKSLDKHVRGLVHLIMCLPEFQLN